MGRLPAEFRGIIPPVSTPMTEGFEVDETSLRQLIAFLLDGGVSGLFMLGSTSEAVFLTDAQRARVIEIAVDVAAGRVPVLVGIVDMTTGRCMEHAQVAERLGADALVLTAPFYMTPSQGEIVEHFRLYRAAYAGDWETARKEQARLFRLFSIVRAAMPGRMGGGSAAFGAFKTALMLRGVIATNVVGRPQLQLNEDEVARVRETLMEVNLL